MAHDQHEHDHGEHHGHSHGHSHGPGHSHSHGPATFNRAFGIGIGLNASFVVAEVIYGLAAHSLALISDAGHNTSDVLGLVLAWAAMKLSSSRPTERRTYGLRRSSILAALGNAAMLLFVTGAVTWEAIRRFSDPQAVVAMTIVWVAALGIVINGVTALLFFRGRGHDVNVRGAFLHMAADALISAGVVVTGLAIRWTGWLWLDPAISVVIGLLVALSTWGLLRESMNLAMDAVPNHIDPTAVSAFLCGVPGVQAVHDLHIWPMSTTETALTAHLVAPGGGIDDQQLAHIARELRQRFTIGHSTIQLERGGLDATCEQEPAETV